MTRSSTLELPPERRQDLRKARRLEWLTIAYLISAIILLALVLGSSQTMKAAWAEDVISLVPPIAFLVAARFHLRSPTKRFPYGFHRAFSTGHLCAALALFAMGAYLLVDSSMKLLTAEHPTISSIELFGQSVWLGWLMIPALIYSGLPAVFIGRAKLSLGEKLHNKALYADAKMNKADWLTAVAAIAGIVGIGLGFWWADSVAAGLISLDILKDGVSNLRRSVVDLMDQTPTTVEQDSEDPLRERVVSALRELDWVEDAEVRLREEGQVYFGEAFVVPSDEADPIRRIDEATEHAQSLDWRVHDLVVTVVDSLPRDG